MPLSFFQLDNLLKQRVAFFMFSWVDLSVLNYAAMEKRHLEQIMIPMPAGSGMSDLQKQFTEKAIQKNAPIILIDEDGIETRELALTLEEQGYINVFWILDGLKGLTKEKAGR